ncbi:MAG TPA: hypothetical protein VJI46_06960 [Candidatus Nanoarchaeia archaeon]|nr:hypothetical protein [Candidatus Nanoarchaeia archaeon]
MEKKIPKKKITTREIVLSLPFFAAFIWFVSLIANTNTAQQNLALSPGRFNALVTVLFLFILIYGALLFYIFRALRKEEGIEKEMEARMGKIKAKSESMAKRHKPKRRK